MEDLINLLMKLNFSNLAWQIMAPIIFSLGDLVSRFYSSNN